MLASPKPAANSNGSSHVPPHSDGELPPKRARSGSVDSGSTRGSDKKKNKKKKKKRQKFEAASGYVARSRVDEASDTASPAKAAVPATTPPTSTTTEVAAAAPPAGPGSTGAAASKEAASGGFVSSGAAVVELAGRVTQVMLSALVCSCDVYGGDSCSLPLMPPPANMLRLSTAVLQYITKFFAIRQLQMILPKLPLNMTIVVYTHHRNSNALPLFPFSRQTRRNLGQKRSTNSRFEIDHPRARGSDPLGICR